MRPHHFIPVIPALALVLMPFLPFVNTAALWLGLPRMMVWGGAWCVLLTAALLICERLMGRERAVEEGVRE
jgi:protein-S-isoprenylcysteine O-methyltransferase Ste14